MDYEVSCLSAHPLLPSPLLQEGMMEEDEVCM